MDVNDLTDTLTAHTPDPEAVLTALRSKRRRRTVKRTLVLGTAASAVAVTLLAANLAPTDRAVEARPSPAAPTAFAGAAGCASDPMARILADARARGASIITAKGTLAVPALPGFPYSQLELRDVHTLAGPAVTPGARAWVFTPPKPPGLPVDMDTGTLLAPDGSLFGIVDVRADVQGRIGAFIRATPLVADQVVLSSGECWLAPDLAGTPFSGPLWEVPGSDSYTRAVVGGIRAVPLATVEALIPR